MTLYQVIQAMEAAALAQPSVRTIVPNDVFRLNTMPSVEYGVVAWTQGTHRQAGDFLEFAFNLFYVDRLTEDKGNEVEVQSAGVQTLGNVLRVLAEQGVPVTGDPTFQTFNQRFMDECAGVWCSATFMVPVDYGCAIDYENE